MTPSLQNPEQPSAHQLYDFITAPSSEKAAVYILNALTGLNQLNPHIVEKHKQRWIDLISSVRTQLALIKADTPSHQELCEVKNNAIKTISEHLATYYTDCVVGVVAENVS